MFTLKPSSPTGRSFWLGCAATLAFVSLVTTLLTDYFGVLYSSRVQPVIRVSATTPADRVPPWGAIEATALPLANPDGLPVDESVRLQPPQWMFEGFSQQKLIRFLRACDLRLVQRRILLDKSVFKLTATGCQISPPEPLVWSLNGRSRRQIYSMLARFPANYVQRVPLRFAVAGFESRLKESGLTRAELKLIQRLTYTNADTLCLSDLQAVQRVLPPSSFHQFVETLYQIPAFTLRLRLTPGADVDELIRYWGKAGREKLISPLLKALARVPGGGSINVSYLLPPFARLRLYTYPDAWEDANAARQDCFFTSMNFFSEIPDTNFFDVEYAQQRLNSDYVPVTDRLGFGDLITLLDSNGKAIHMCVYIADDFVFTKNGITREQPWVLMRLSDMLMIFFAPQSAGKMLLLRHKDTRADSSA